jgi:glucose-1-phosphate thymidylyltransferase
LRWVPDVDGTVLIRVSRVAEHVKAIVLAGGHATRLWPITRDRPKPLLPLGDRTILARLLDQLAPVADEIVVSTNEKFEAEFAQAIEDVPAARLEIEKQASEAEKPGALGALFQVVDGLSADEDVLVVGGDNHYGFPLKSFVAEARDRDAPTVATKKLPSREEARAFGVVELARDTEIQAFHEKPDEPPSTLAATALYYYPAGWDKLFADYKTVAENSDDPEEMFDAPGRILEWAVEDGRPVHAWSFEEDWFDIGTAQGYLDALEQVVGDRYVEGDLTGCDVEGGVYVFGDARARDSELERVVLLPGAEVVDAELEDTIVDNHAYVEDVEFQGSRVGAYDEIRGD